MRRCPLRGTIFYVAERVLLLVPMAERSMTRGIGGQIQQVVSFDVMRGRGQL